MPFDLGDDINPYIVGIGSRVTSEDIDTYDKLEEVRSRSESRRSERTLRQIYGLTLLALLCIEIAAVLIITFLMGFGVIKIDQWAATTFIGGTLGQVSGMTFLIIRYLFPVNTGGDHLDQS